MYSSISTSPTSSEDEENKFLKASSDTFDVVKKPRSNSVCSEPLQTIPEVLAEEEDYEEYPGKRRGSLKKGSKPKKMLRKSVSPRNLDHYEPWAYGITIKDDFFMDRKTYQFQTSLDRQVILEEETEIGEKDASPRISLVVDKTEQAFDKKRRMPFDSQDSIQEERNEEEEKVLVLRHSDFYKKIDDEFSSSPRSSLVYLVPSESIKEEDEGDEDQITLKHDEFMKRITLQDEQYIPIQESLMSSLQEVYEEDEDLGPKEL
jgi:hypothetical protein